MSSSSVETLRLSNSCCSAEAMITISHATNTLKTPMNTSFHTSWTRHILLIENDLSLYIMKFQS